MRRVRGLLILLLIPLSACAVGSTTPVVSTSTPGTVSSDAESAAEVTTSSGASSVMTTASSAAMTDGNVSPGTTTAQTTAPVTEGTTTPEPTSAAAGTQIITGGSDFGEILFDTTGQAIYLFDKETAGTPDCYDDCAVAWPPVLTAAAPIGGGGVRQTLLGSTPRVDGSLQVTYAGHPLYFYANEGKNEVTCHDVTEFGGRWLVVTPGGEAAA